MKAIYTLLLLTFLSFYTKAQNFILNFEDTTVINQVYYTDSILDPQHIWQIGVPNKPFFDSAYSPVHAVVTLLDSAMPENAKASFVIAIPNPNQIYSGYFGYYGSLLTFTHKFDFDLGKGGAYVEYSVDSGNHWHPISTNGAHYIDYNSSSIYCITGNYGIPQIVDGQMLFPPLWWSFVPTDTTPQGIPYFTVTDSTWIQDSIVMPAQLGEKTYQNNLFLFRFTAFTDSNSLSKEGWMIDNISFQQYFFSCPGGINEINSSHLKIYPDPVSDGFTLSLISTNVHAYEVSLIDLMGRILLSKDENEKVITLRREDIAAGSYIVRVRDKESGDTMEKRVLFE
jgi:hypothetical protein